jgi:hypothetical protein
MQQWLMNYAKEVEKDFPEYVDLSKKVKMSSQFEYDDYQYGDLFSIKLKKYNSSISFTLYEGTIRKEELLFQHFCSYVEEQSNIQALIVHDDPRFHAIVPIGEKIKKMYNWFSYFQHAMIRVDGKISWNSRFIYPLFFTFDLTNEHITIHDEREQTIYTTLKTDREVQTYFEHLQQKEEDLNEAIDHLLQVLKKDYPNAYLNKQTNHFIAFGEVLSFSFLYKHDSFSFALKDWHIFLDSSSLANLLEKIEEEMKPHIQQRRIRSMFQ